MHSDKPVLHIVKAGEAAMMAKGIVIHVAPATLKQAPATIQHPA